jgi:hypothetical protein
MTDQTIASRISWLLVAVAAPLLIAGMLSLNVRLCAVGAAVAVVGIVIRIARL